MCGRSVRTDVDGDVLGVDAPLEFAHLGVVPPTPEESRGLNPEVAHLAAHNTNLERSPTHQLPCTGFQDRASENVADATVLLKQSPNEPHRYSATAE